MNFASRLYTSKDSRGIETQCSRHLKARKVRRNGMGAPAVVRYCKLMASCKPEIKDFWAVDLYDCIVVKLTILWVMPELCRMNKLKTGKCVRIS